jgi:hypothetical protein
MVRASLTKPYAARVLLEPLSPVQITVMAQDILGVETIPAEIEQLIVSKTDGNPLFIEELTRSLLESGALVQTPTGYVLTRPLQSLDVPPRCRAFCSPVRPPEDLATPQWPRWWAGVSYALLASVFRVASLRRC